MTASIDPELRTKIDTACRMEEEFKLYNEKIAKKRHQMIRLYMVNGLLVWNGNVANGKDNIQKYFQELPLFEHIMNTLVAQPIIGDAVSSQLTFIIKVSGTVIYQDNSTKPFQKTFTVTAQGDKWKISSDCSAASGCWMLSFKGIGQYMDALEGDIPAGSGSGFLFKSSL